MGASFLGPVKTFGARWAWQAISSQATPPIFNDIASYPLIKKTKFSKLLEGCTTPIKKLSFIDFEINLFDLKDGKFFRLNI